MAEETYLHISYPEAWEHTDVERGFWEPKIKGTRECQNDNQWWSERTVKINIGGIPKSKASVMLVSSEEEYKKQGEKKTLGWDIERAKPDNEAKTQQEA